jgi:hypothetical protein
MFIKAPVPGLVLGVGDGDPPVQVRILAVPDGLAAVLVERDVLLVRGALGDVDVPVVVSGDDARVVDVVMFVDPSQLTKMRSPSTAWLAWVRKVAPRAARRSALVAHGQSVDLLGEGGY